MKRNYKIIILNILILIMFIIIGISVKASDEGILFDKSIIEYIHNKTTPLGISIMKKVTYFGSAYFFIPAGLVIFLIMMKKKNIYGVILLILSTLGSFGLNFIMKSIFIRVRPLKYFLIEQGGYSFPSGHAMVSMTFYTTMIYLILKSKSRKKTKRILWIVNFIVISLIGFSRVYLGVHWPTDVLGGYLSGYLFYRFVIRILSERLYR